MSYLNLNRNTFLEKEELIRFQQFLAEDASKILFLKNTTDFGIVLSDFIEQSDFSIAVGTNPGTIKLVTDSYAFDKDGLLIHQLPFDNLEIPNNSAWYWVRISQKYINTEVGTLSISTDGVLSGVNTLFTSVLRGSSTDVPVKIKFVKTDGTTLLNTGVYELVSITNNTNAAVTGSSFVSESNLKYIVIGCTPIGETISSGQLEGLYQYDDCKFELVAEETLNTPPTINYIADKTFYLARVKNVSGTVTVQDKRTNWWLFNIPGLLDKMDKSSNLSDIIDFVAARNNLGVYSKSEVDTITNPINNHQQSVGVTSITATGSRVDMNGMSLTYTPKGHNAMIMFSALLHTSITTQSVTMYLVQNNIDIRSFQMTIYQHDLTATFQYILPVSKGVSTTIKIAWNGTTNISQNGTNSPRILSIIDLP